MSRIGNQPIPVPAGVKVEIKGTSLQVEGPKGKLNRSTRPEVELTLDDGHVVVRRKGDSKAHRAFHGLERALVSNMVTGVSTGFVKELQLIGVGYRAEVSGTSINLALGYSHPIDFKLPVGVTGQVLKEGRDLYIRLEGIDRQLVGQVAAEIRSLRPPEPYKGKGIRYRTEVVKTKVGKTSKK